MKVYNLDALPPHAVEAFSGGCVTQALGQLAGSEKFYVNIDVVPPGQRTSKFHAHTRQEEFFLVLEGEGTLRTGDGEAPLRPGDFFSKPAGLANPHTIYNSGAKPLRVLDIGTNEQGDVAFYPDDNVYLLRGTGIALEGIPLEGWTSEPNQEAKGGTPSAPPHDPKAL